MAKKHGRFTTFTLAGSPVWGYANSSQKEFTGDSHDVTTYGKNSHVFSGGLKNGTATIGGFYDDTVAGPAAVIKPLVMTVVEFIHRPEGDGSGRPQDKVQALILKYNETAPVADMVTWTCDLQFSDDVDSTPQP